MKIISDPCPSEELYRSVSKEIVAKYAIQWQKASCLKRLWLRYRIHREIRLTLSNRLGALA